MRLKSEVGSHLSSSNSTADMDADSTDSSSSDKCTIVMSSSLNDSADGEEDSGYSHSPLSRDAVCEVWEKETANKGTKFEHAGHETNIEAISRMARGCFRELVVELPHREDDTNNALIW